MAEGARGAAAGAGGGIGKHGLAGPGQDRPAAAVVLEADGGSGGGRQGCQVCRSVSVFFLFLNIYGRIPYLCLKVYRQGQTT